MDHDSIMLSEISQKEKDKYCMISFTCAKEAEFIDTESRMVGGYQGWGLGE